jgi:ribosomal-protein-alanine N-acetyltransferase
LAAAVENGVFGNQTGSRIVPEQFNFETFPILKTERLVLRQLRLDDVDAVFAMRSDYEVTRLNIGSAYTSVEQARALIESILDNYKWGNELRWGITLKNGDDTVIGMCGYNYWARHDFRGSVGYDLARAYWGQGIMTEAVRAVIKFGFERMGLNRIEADASVENEASIRILERLGFQREGIEREQYFEGGEFHDLMLFSLLRRDYKG